MHLLLQQSHLAAGQEHSHSAVNFVVLLVLLRILILALFPVSLCSLKLQAEGNKSVRVLHEKSKVLMKNELIGTILYILGTDLNGRQAMDS